MLTHALRLSVTLCLGGSALAASPFATRVIEYLPAPGQNVNNSLLNNPAAALGPPVGGGLSTPDNSKIVTLGAFGGTITLGFDHRIPARPVAADNPAGACAIVFGNAFHVGGDPNRRWAEAAVIEVARDDNANGLADDPWYLIRGSHTPALPATPLSAFVTKGYADPVLLGPPPLLPASWLPPGRAGTSWTVGTYQLPSGVFASSTVPIVINPLGAAAAEQGIWGYADCSPTLLLGDLDADDVVDDAAMTPEDFYTLPGNPLLAGVSPGSCGGDGFSLAWAVDPATGLPPSSPLDGFDFLRITTAADRLSGPLGELSTEIGGVAEAIPLSARLPPPCPLDFNLDGVINPDDLGDYITGYFQVPSDPLTEFNGDGVINPDDLGDYITGYFTEPHPC
ncbi:MAG: hypothetical protein ACKVS8_08395 [Phycisphaerales bacterium]